ncbi:MAG: YhbY family RNA-binding protein [Rubrivivax sp.]|jgi:putative YhbY family RNA-binding protein|nr:YhbY family RNA-binding protein [Rubrivivax sp.]
MPALTLSTSERRTRRADAHHLNPVVMVGGDGLTPSVVREIDLALQAHGLIKVRVFSDERDTRETMLAELCEQLGAAPVQHIGKLLVLWRPIPEKAPEPDADRKPGPRIVKIVSFSKSGNHRATVKKVKVFGNQRVTAGGLVKRKDNKRVAISPKKRSEG